MLTPVYTSAQIVVYKIEDKTIPLLNRYIVSSNETREICNDPQICGIEYTKKLRDTCTKILEALPAFSPVTLYENQGVVLNILRAGLNFGIREALADAYGWNIHPTSFINTPRAHSGASSDQWQIQEDTYYKLKLPEHAQIIFGDIVATGTSLQHALRLLVKEAITTGVQIQNMVFFTFGGVRSEEILQEVAETCKKNFDQFSGIELFYLEGRFEVPDKQTPISIKEIGTDLIRNGALMADEFINSQYELPYYPLERCVIYNAGARAFNVEKYIEDVIYYWEEVKQLAAQGYSFEDLLKERFPEIDSSKFGKQNLMSLAEQHIIKLKRILQPKLPTTE